MSRRLLESHRHPQHPRLTVQLRASSRYYQAITFLDRKKRQVSLKTDVLPTAFKLAEHWYKRQLRASVAFGRQHPIERLTADPTLAELFTRYKATIATETRRTWADWRWGPIADFWRTKTLREITPQTIRDFYVWRRKRRKTITPHTLHKDIVLVRQILKYAIEAELLDRLPAMPKPGPIRANPRPWLTRQEWDHLMKVSEARVEAVVGNDRLFRQRVDTHEFAQMMVITMCRVDELLALRFCDCRYEARTNGETKPSRPVMVLIADVTGKRGTRTIVAPPEAARIVKARRARLDHAPRLKDTPPEEIDTERVFPVHRRAAFRALLETANLYQDAQGFTRNFKSLRATAISFRILAAGANANLLMIARAAGTSVQMIDMFYARRLSPELFKDDLGQTIIEVD